MIFGGIHGNVPITPESGRQVAEVIVNTGISAVIDVSDFTVGEQHRFVSDFAERFFEMKKQNPGHVHVFFDEAHTFAPQDKGDSLGPALMIMFNRVERLIRVGRNHGIGSTQISQMPQAVSTKTRNQISLLLAGRTLGTHERKALTKWFGDNTSVEGEDVKVNELLPKLETGTFYAASPFWLKLSKVVRLTGRKTFDSSKTPEFGAKAVRPKVLTPVDVAAIREALRTTVEQAEKDDPVALRRRVADLEKQLKAKETKTPKVAEAPKPKPPPKPMPLEKDIARLHKEGSRIVSYIDAQAAHLKAVAQECGKLLDLLRPALEPVIKAPLMVPLSPQSLSASIKKAPPPPPTPQELAAIDRELPTPGKGPRAILRAIAGEHPEQLTRQQIACLSGLDVNGGTFNTYFPVLRAAGWLGTLDGKTIGLSAEGLAASAPDWIGSPVDLKAIWRKKLPKGALPILDALAGFHPGQISRRHLAIRSLYVVDGGTFNTYLPQLKRSGLVVEEAGLHSVTAEGLRAAQVEKPQELSALRSEWKKKIPTGATKIFDALLAAGKLGLTRDELAERSGYDKNGGTFNTYVPKLKNFGLTAKDGDRIKLVEELLQ